MNLLALLPALVGPVPPAPAPLVCPFPSHRQEAQEPQEGEAEASDHILSLSLGDAAKWLTHPKDAALLRAFTMLDERLEELPGEIRSMPPPIEVAMQPDAIDTWLHLLRAQKRFTLAAAPPELMERGQPVVFGVSLDEADPAAAAAYHAELTELFERMDAPFPMEMIGLSGRSLSVEMGATARPMGRTAAAAALQGSELTMEMVMDFGGYLHFLQMLMEQSGAPGEMDVIFDVFGRMGLDDMTIEIASANEGAIARTISIASGIGPRMLANGMLPEEGMTPALLAPVPADATWFAVERLDLAAAFEAMNGVASEFLQEQGGGGDIAEMVMSTTGIDLRAGIFGALGDTLGVYASETTGGGTASSTVMFASVRDLDALLDSKEQIVEILNSLAAANMEGYASIRTWSRGDTEYSTLVFPGLPVPLELTLGFSEAWVVAAATPQAALAAMGQIESNGAGFGGDERVAALLRGGTKSAISFMDTARYARSGYGMTSMMMSAMSNSVRSRVDGLRDPGPIMPLYADFAAGIVPTFGTTELVGDKLVTVQTTDSSIVVQLAMTMGFLYEYLPVFALPALGAAAPQIVQEMQRGF